MPDNIDRFRVRVTEEGDTVHVAVAGEIDLATAPTLSSRLEEVLDHKPAVVVLDTSEAPFIDSAGIAAVLACYRDLRGFGGEMRLGPMSPEVERVLQVAGVLDQLPRSGNASGDG